MLVCVAIAAAWGVPTPGKKSAVDSAPPFYQIETGRHQAPVIFAGFLRDGTPVSVSMDGTIREWSLQGGPAREPVRLFAVDAFHGGVSSACLHDSLLAVGHQPSSDAAGAPADVTLVDLSSREPTIQKVLPGPPTGAAIGSLAFSPDGQRLAAGSAQTLRVWANIQSGESFDLAVPNPKGSLETWDPQSISVAFSGQKTVAVGGWFVSSSSREQFVLAAFDVESKKPLGMAQGGGRLISIAPADSGDVAYALDAPTPGESAGPGSGTWNTRGGALRPLALPKGVSCSTAVHVASSHKLLFIGSPDGATGAIFSESGPATAPVKVSDYPLYSAGVDPAGRNLIAGDVQGGLWLMPLAGGAPKNLAMPTPPVSNLGWSPKRELLVKYPGGEEAYSVDDLTTSKADQAIPPPQLTSGGFSMRLGAKGNRVLIRRSGAAVDQIEADFTGKMSLGIENPTPSPMSFFGGSDPHLLALGGAAVIKLYTFGDADRHLNPITSQGRAAVMLPNAGEFTRFAVSGDGKYVAAAESNHQIDIYQVDAVKNGDTDPMLILFAMPPENGQAGEWVFWYPKTGVFASSPGGSKMLGVQINQGPDKTARLASADQVRNQFYRPAQVQAALTTGPPPSSGSMLAVITSTPDMRVEPLQGLEETDRLGYYKANSTQVKVNVRFSGRVSNVVVAERLKAKNVDVDEGGNAKPLTISLVPGPNFVTLVGSGPDGFTDRLVLHIDCQAEGGKWGGSLHVVSIGINDYDNKGIGDLTKPASDAKNVDDFYAAPGRLPGQNASHELIPQDKADSGSVMARIQATMDQAATGDDLILFMSGHGAPDNGKYYFLTKNADMHQLASTAIDWQTIIDAAKKSKLRNILIVADACFAGGAISGEAAADDRSLRQQTITDMTDSAHVMLLVSSTPYQVSYEDPKAQGSLFTDAWLKVLTDHLKAQPASAADPMVYMDDSMFGDLVLEMATRVKADKRLKTQQPMFYPQNSATIVAARGASGQGQ